MFKNHYEGELAIGELIKKDNNCSAHFDYKFVEGAELDLVTYNPKSSTFFLLHNTKGNSKLDVITKMYNYLFTLKVSLKTKENSLNSYTIDWYNSVEEKQFKSFFYGESVDSVLKKFNYGKTLESYIIYNIRLNPKS